MEMIARYKPGENIAGFCTAQVEAGRFVKISGAKTTHGDYSIAHCGAGERAIGVSERKSGPATDPADEWTRRVNVFRGGIARVTAGAAITAGDQVQSDADGKAIPLAAGVAIGQAVSTAANGAVVEIALYQ